MKVLLVLGLCAAVFADVDENMVSLLEQETGKEISPKAVEEIAEVIEGDLNADEMGAEAKNLMGSLSDEKVNKVVEDVRALEVAEILTDSQRSKDSKVEEVEEVLGGTPLSEDEAALTDEMKQALGQGPLTPADKEIIKEANDMIEEGLSPAEVESEEEDEPLSETVGEIDGQIAEPAGKAAFEKEVVPATAENTPTLSNDEMAAIDAVLKTDGVDAEDKAEVIASMLDDTPLTQEEQQKIAADLNAEGKLNVENANIVKALGDKEAMEALVAEAANDAVEDLVTAAASKPNGEQIAAEIIMDADDVDTQKFVEIVGKPDMPEADETPVVTEGEKEAVELIVKNEELSEDEKVDLASHVLDGKALSPAQAQQIARELPAMTAEESNVMAELTNDETVEKADKRMEVAAKEENVIPEVIDVANDFVEPEENAPTHEVAPQVPEAEDEVLGENAIMKLIGRRMLRFIHAKRDPEAKAAFQQKFEEPAASEFWTRIADLDSDGRISSQEWRKVFESELTPYWKSAFGTEIDIPEQEWMTVDTNKDGFVDFKTEIFPTLFDMVDEPIFRALYAALFRLYDADRNGILDQTPNPRFAGKSEYSAWSEHPFVRAVSAFPEAQTSEVQAELDDIVREGGDEEGKGFLEQIKEEQLVEQQ